MMKSEIIMNGTESKKSYASIDCDFRVNCTHREHLVNHFRKKFFYDSTIDICSWIRNCFLLFIKSHIESHPNCVKSIFIYLSKTKNKLIFLLFHSV